MNIAVDALCPERLLNLTASPLVILNLVVDESPRISLVIDKLLLDEAFHDACLRLIAHSPQAHLLQHLARRVFATGTKRHEFAQRLLFGNLFLVVHFLPLIILVFPN